MEDDGDDRQTSFREVPDLTYWPMAAIGKRKLYRLTDTHYVL